MLMRSFLRLTLGSLAAATALCAVQAHAAEAPPLTVHTIKAGKLYWVEGGGGNSGVIIGRDGVIVVDAKTTPEAARQMLVEIAKLTPKPVTHVIITHSDGDHVNGLAGFPDGLTIIGHVNNKREQQAVYLFAAVEVGGGRCLPPANRLPNKVVMKSRVATRLAGEPVVLHHFGPAHTSGDLVVEFPEERIAFAGDLLTSTVLIHPEKMGSLAGWFDTARAMLALPVDRYVGGHARELDTKDSLKKRMAEYQAVRDKVGGLVAQGLDLPAVKKAMGDPEKDPSGCRGIPFPSIGHVEFNEKTARDQELK
jgi:cyclase